MEGWRGQQDLEPMEKLWRGDEHQLVLLGGEQLVDSLVSSGPGRGVAGAEAEAGGAGEEQQEGEEGGGETLGVQGGWW